MSETPDLPPLREVIRQHNLRAEKSLGQNFLLDGNITDKIVRLSGDLTGLHMIEIGPGPGGLTRSLLTSPAASVTAIEFDPRAVTAITDLKALYGERLTIIHGDALKTDVTQITPAPRAIAANLPYNISTVLLTNWLKQIHTDPAAISFMALMFQKEVAQRIMTPSGSKTYGRLSVLAQWLTTPKKLFDLPPSAFTPPPKISSSVIHFTPKNLGPDKPAFELFEDITAKAFGQRRKMIRSSLVDYKDAVELAGIDTTLRAEDLSVDDFVAIARVVRP
ncbi:MAG: 16S rRNA (adenine(1518)-N(6)/adenine(1519)-N(6))-dimethyltransferase RsmA [Pseudobdellovibrionaceae bacterium]